jgi:RNA polymerase sigma factor (sigma-70 family)
MIPAQIEGHGTPPGLESDVGRAVAGDREALERVVLAIQPEVYRLALRFLWHPEDAEDASQEILIRIITRLGTYRHESAFRTWVYRVAANALLTMRRRRAEQHTMSLEAFGEDLEQGLSDETPAAAAVAEHELLLDEIRIGCTMAMLLCLDRPLRLAYILGEIMDLDHNEGASVMEIKPAAFRARLSRARRAIQSVMTSHCGLVNPANACRCRKRVKVAIELGRVDPQRLLFASSLAHARAFPGVLQAVRRLEEGRRAAAIHRAQSDRTPREFANWVRRWLDQNWKA